MNDNVMTFIELELKKDPGVSNATLFEGAKLIDKTIAKLNPRQFHAKYPLQVKRRLGAGSAAPARAKAKAAPARARAKATRSRASMADAGAAVLQYVTRMLGENPGVSNAELFKGACEIDASVADLAPRQFHAKYPLQVKRRLAAAAAEAEAPATPAAPASAPAPAPAPEPEAPSMGDGDAVAVRGMLLNLARELANAGTQAETIEVMARLDGYVDDIMQAARS